MMLRALIKKQLLELFQGYLINKKTGKMRSKGSMTGFIILMAALFVMLGGLFFVLGMSVGTFVIGGEIAWVYFAIIGLLSMALGVFGSVFNTYASLYLPKDNEQLMSLPIPPRKLLIARMVGVYLISLMYSAWVWIPGMLAYWILVPEITSVTIIYPVVLTFIVALFVSVLTCALGYLIAILAQKSKGKSYVSVIAAVLGLAAYYVIYFKLMNNFTQIMQNMDVIGGTMQKWLHYTSWLGSGANGNTRDFLIVIAITLALAVLCVRVLSRSFIKLAIYDVKTEKKAVRDKDYAAKGLRQTLLRHELRRFASVSAWMLNGGLGMLVMPILAVLALVKGEALRGAYTDALGLLGIDSAALACAVIGAAILIISMDCITTASVSIEAKTLWQIRSLPVSAWDVLRAKVGLGISLNTIPALFFAVSVCVALRLPVLASVITCAAVLGAVLLFACFGLILDLRNPNFVWTNVSSIAKQGMPVFVHLFGGWAFAAVVGVGGFFLSMAIPAYAALGIVAALVIGIALLLLNWLRKKGTSLFDAL